MMSETFQRGSLAGLSVVLFLKYMNTRGLKVSCLSCCVCDYTSGHVTITTGSVFSPGPFRVAVRYAFAIVSVSAAIP